MTFTRLDWLCLGGAALAATGAFFFFRCLQTRDPQEIERRRRERINRIGRLAPCEILEILEGDADTPAASAHARFTLWNPPRASRRRAELVIYRYTIAGVTYETAQELAESPARWRLPLPGEFRSVRYDPANPSNSILVAENWLTPGTGAGNPVASGKGR